MTTPVRADGEQGVLLSLDGVGLPGLLTLPADTAAVVVFAHGSGSSRLSPRNRFVSALLNDSGIATLMFDLLTPQEAGDRANVFDVDLLAARLAGATEWVEGRPEIEGRPIGYFGASTGTAAALTAAADLGRAIRAVVSRGGRPDLAGGRLASVRAPTLLVVGGADDVVLELNRRALASMTCEAELRVVPGATHLFEEPGAIEEVARLARNWFVRHLVQAT